MSREPTRRVVITGAGLISPLGNTIEEFWSGLRGGRSGVGPLQSLPSNSVPAAAGGEVRNFTSSIEDFGPLDKKVQRNIRKGAKMMCREIAMGVAAAQRALDNAGLAEPGSRNPERTGVVFGSDYIMSLPQEFTDGVRRCLDDEKQFDFGRWAEEGLPKVDPLWLLKYLPNMPASHIAIYNDLQGPNNSLTLREASANLAVGEAYCTIARGDADVIIAGATGTRVHPIRTLYVALQEELAEGRAPERLSRPFDKDRNGMVIGEGAGAVVLECLESAERRGATIWGEVVGRASSTVLQPDGAPRFRQALENVLEMVLQGSGLTGERLGHLHAHGQSSRVLDSDEAHAIRAVVGPKVPVMAAKANLGNLGAGSGIVELIGSLLSLRHGELCPLLNYETPDDDCPLTPSQAGHPAGDSFVNLSITPQAQASAIAVRSL